MPLFEPNYINLEYFFNLIYQTLINLHIFPLPPALIFWLKIILLSLGLFSGFVVVALVVKIINLRKEELRNFLSLVQTDAGEQSVNKKRWEKVLTYLESDNQSDWKQSIIEADNLLDEMVSAMHYPGENLGERLKNIEPSDFVTLQDAWDGHKVRNQIAHESDFTLTRREARRVLELYEKVFTEFNFV